MRLVRVLLKCVLLIRFKAFVETLSGWEDDRRALFFRGEASYGDAYELPVGFGELNPAVLLRALHRLLADAGDDGGQAVTSVRRQKITLRLAMASLWRITPHTRVS